MEEINSLSMSSFFDTHSRGGLVGFKNLGSTCFISSVIQCLSNCEDMAKYFLSKTFMDDINKDSKFGPDGKVAKAFYDVMREIWIGGSASITPLDHKTLFSSLTKQVSIFLLYTKYYRKLWFKYLGCDIHSQN